MKYFAWIFSAIALIISFITGRNSVINAQNKEILEHAKKAKEISDNIRSMSDSELDDELRKKPDDK